MGENEGSTMTGYVRGYIYSTQPNRDKYIYCYGRQTNKNNVGDGKKNISAQSQPPEKPWNIPKSTHKVRQCSRKQKKQYMTLEQFREAWKAR